MMSIFPKMIYGFNAIAIKILAILRKYRIDYTKNYVKRRTRIVKNF